MFVIAGATGNTGRVAAETLLAQGKPVRALVHHPEKGAELRAAGAELFTASLEDDAAIERALAGATAAYFLLPPRVTSTSVLADNAAITERFARAVEKNGVGHVVLLSSIGAHLPDGNGPIKALHRAEKRLAQTGAAVTAVRAGYFMENWVPALGAVAHGILPTFLREGLVAPMVANRDVGLAAARALAEGGKGFQTVELRGPREYTPADVAAAVSTLVGKTITPQYGPEEAIVPAFKSFGMSDDMAGLYREMIVGFNSGAIGPDPKSTRTARGTIPIEKALAPHLKA